MSIMDIRAALERNDIPFQEELPEKLQIYLELLEQWNSRMDLTAVTDKKETIDKHFIDSLAILKTGIISSGAEVIDVGTGAGFPGMVLAMARPDIHVTLLDSQQKRLAFLEHIAEAASVCNTVTVHARAEDGGRMPAMREKFDYATARALAPLNVLCEYLLPYVKTDGYALCWKGPALTDEMENGKKAANMLGGKIETPIISTVDGRDWKHMILPVKKIRPTPALYPRKAGTPKSKPLGI